MEKSLSPLSRALRRFSAGKPVCRPEDTPLRAVLLATEQRERLRAILDSEDIDSPRITHTALVILLDAAGSSVLFDDGPFVVIEGKESFTVRDLEQLLECGHKFTVSGLTFVVQSGAEKPRIFEYRAERTPEGEAALSRAAALALEKRGDGV